MPDIEDWKHEVANDETLLGYEEWLEHKAEEEEHHPPLSTLKGSRHKPCVMFAKRKPLYFHELWESDERITGYVINGGWTLYMLKQGDVRQCYFADTLSGCTDENHFLTCDASEVVIVPVPKEHQRHYNDAINYAESVDLEVADGQ